MAKKPTKKAGEQPGKVDEAIARVKKIARDHRMSVSDVTALLSAMQKEEESKAQIQFLGMQQELLGQLKEVFALGADKIKDILKKAGEESGGDYHYQPEFETDIIRPLLPGSIVHFVPTPSTKEAISQLQSPKGAYFPAMILEIPQRLHDVKAKLMVFTPVGSVVVDNVVPSTDAVGEEANYFMRTEETFKRMNRPAGLYSMEA